MHRALTVYRLEWTRSAKFIRPKCLRMFMLPPAFPVQQFPYMSPRLHTVSQSNYTSRAFSSAKSCPPCAHM
jgi:hypothetical protein